MKHTLFFYLPFLFFNAVILAEETSSTPVAKPQHAAVQAQKANKPSHDYAPEILGTFFQSVIPSFLHMAAAAEADDTEAAWESLAGMFQGIGAIIDYGTRALKDDPSLDVSEALRVFMQSTKGKQLLTASKSLNIK
jgi:hypothetical protein